MEIIKPQFLKTLYFISSEMSSHFSEPGWLPDFANSLCRLAEMEKRKDQCTQVHIRYPWLISDSWVRDFEAAIRGHKPHCYGNQEPTQEKKTRFFRGTWNLAIHKSRCDPYVVSFPNMLKYKWIPSKSLNTEIGCNTIELWGSRNIT